MLTNLFRAARAKLGMTPHPAEMLGAKPDTYDSRDYIKATVPVPLPDRVDLSTYGRKEPWMQGRVGACTGFSAAMLVANVFGRLNPDKAWDPSPLFLYYRARELDGNVGRDVGASLRSMMQVLATGIAPLDAHPTLTDWTQPPSQAALDTASLMKIHDYQRIRVGPEAPVEMQRVLHYESLPIVVAITLHENVYSKVVSYDGALRLPTENDVILGTHALMIDGYDATTERFHGWNSWGKAWGDGGRFSVPFEYFRRYDLAWDIWTFTPKYW